MSRFSTAVTRQRHVGIVDLTGDLDGGADSALAQAYDEAVTSGASTVLLDFSEVGYINSTGIAVVIGLLARARRDHRDVRVCGLTHHYRHVFEITRLADFMTFYGSRQEAVGDTVIHG